ncbi:LysR substrate-binding domain-containing protein [Pseudomonas sp. NPDC090592]|uniref:LysR substrate-binding domain-containing protein n=1 Tax=Pseudomonas sp. NPDC090592 TaxID=3364480 RepID=UPI00383B2FD8
MNRNELRKADINLMVVFEALMQERNLTRAAEKLFIAQPTVSAALARLRAMFNDPLLIRVGNRMQPSARAEEVIKHLTPALDAMSIALSLSHDFDPATSNMTFRIGLSDDVESGLLPPLLRALRVEAPNVVVVVQHVDYWRIPDLLAAGDVTVGISQTKGLPANAKRKVLRTLQGRVVRADKSATPLTLDEFCSRPHVQVSPTANTQGVVDEWLKEVGRERKVVLSVPQFSSLPAILAGTDLLACCPDYAAQGMERWGNLQAETLPFEAPALELAMVWLSTTDSDPAERWLRSRLEQYMGGEREVAVGL